MSCFACIHPVDDRQTDFSSGDVVCTACGAVLCSRLIDEAAEWTSYDDSGKADMRRASALSRGGVMQTNICIAGDRDGSVRLNLSMRSAQDKQIDSSVSAISDLAYRLRAGDKVVRRAVDMGVDLIRRDAVRCLPESSVAAALLFLACSLEGLPRTLSEVAQSSCVSRKDICRLSAKISGALALQRQAIQPESLVHRVCSQLRIEFSAAELAREMCVLVAQREITDAESPQAVAAACILIVLEVVGGPVDLAALERAALATLSSVLRLKAKLESYMELIRPPRLIAKSTAGVACTEAPKTSSKRFKSRACLLSTPAPLPLALGKRKACDALEL